MYAVHLDTLGIIHESTCIADIENRVVNNICGYVYVLEINMS
jgi:hypothetical protein